MTQRAAAQMECAKSNDAADSHPLPRSPLSPQKPQKPVLPQSPQNPPFPLLHLSPLSNRQELEKQLKELAHQNAVGMDDEEEENRWQLARDARAVELATRTSIAESTLMLDEWCRC